MTRAGLGAGAGVSVSLIAADDEGAVLITALGDTAAASKRSIRRFVITEKAPI